MPRPQTVKVDPTAEHKIPFDTSDEKPNTLLDELAVAANTVELQHELGATLEVDEETAEQEKKLLDEVITERKKGNLTQPNTAFAAAAFLRTYGQQLGLDAAEARAAITNKLMEIADCGDIKFELKALELLGKHSDIGLFTQKSEITINYKSPEDLESAIKERVKRLLNADVIDVTPLNSNLDDELGVATIKKQDEDDDSEARVIENIKKQDEDDDSEASD